MNVRVGTTFAFIMIFLYRMLGQPLDAMSQPDSFADGSRVLASNQSAR